VTFDYDVRAKLAPLLLFLCGELTLAWGDEYSTDASVLALVMGAGLIFGLISIELVTSNALRRRLPRSMGGHARRLLTVIATFVAVRWVLDGFEFKAPWRSFIGWLVAWTLMYTALVWAAYRSSVSDGTLS
jgi:hypothetical protein